MTTVFDRMMKAYHINPYKKMTRAQEMAIWWTVCVGSSYGGRGTCPDGLVNQTVKVVQGHEYDDGLTYFVGDEFGPESSGVGAVYMPEQPEGFCSFTADTRVLMADGTAKPISKVAIGDQIASADPQRGTQTERTVTQQWKHRDAPVRLMTSAGAITTTAGHPFWDDRHHRWTPAADLTPGTPLRTADGSRVTVKKVAAAGAEPVDAYNLTVSELHTYYVLAGTTPILVHNQCGPLRYITYIKPSLTPGGVPYVGRTRGYGTPGRILADRDAGHHLNGTHDDAILDTMGDATLPVDQRHSDPAYQAMRGREQDMIDYYGGAQSQGGTSANKIRGIALDNELLETYMEAAGDAFARVEPGGGISGAGGGGGGE
jgi:hypothetical protein